MIFISVEDFLNQAGTFQSLTREEEKRYAERMKAGDVLARKAIIESYLPLIAANIRNCPAEDRTLELLYRCMDALEKAADSFDFQQDSERFTHRLSWWLRQTVTRYTAEQRNNAAQDILKGGRDAF